MVLDSSLFIAKETGARYTRFIRWNMQDKQMTRLILYFGKEDFFFTNKTLPYIKSGGTTFIAVPGIKASMTDAGRNYLRLGSEKKRNCFRAPISENPLLAQ